MRLSYVVLAALAAAFLSTARAEAQTCLDIPNCDSCPNPTICDACQTGRFFVVPQGGSPTCQTCTVCQANEVEVSPCSPFIDRQCAAVCPEGTVDVGGTCQDCGVLDCATCSAPGTCTQCAAGFVLDVDTCVPACGDSYLQPGESCDDGNVASGDGCSSTCAIESGYSCEGEPSYCSLSTTAPPYGGSGGICSASGDRTPPFSWLALPLGLVAYAIGRRRK